jgi:alpha-1,2-glucosyltransferase
MDEEFHVPQTQAYCEERWSQWHPKITTFPGLYVTAVPYARALQTIGQLTGLATYQAEAAAGMDIVSTQASDPMCSVTVLRSINILYGVLCIPVFFALLRTLHPAYYSSRPGRLLLTIVQLSLFPLSFFFMFLFYTDGASVFWTLAFYLSYLRGHRVIGALLGAAAVGVRQTNVAWIAFVLLSDIVHAWSQGDSDLFGEQHARAAAAAIKSKDSLASGTDGEKESKLARESLLRYHPPSWSTVPRSLLALVFDCLRSLPRLMLRHCLTLLLCMAFVAFVMQNGGSVVVGDRENHEFTKHFPQLLYFMAFAAGFTVTNWISIGSVTETLLSLKRHPFLSLLFLSVASFVVLKCTMAHPFLLADNRHYTFYLWKNSFRRWDGFKYAVIPLYFMAAGVMQRAWTGSRGEQRLIQLLFWIVTALCLVPTPLLEPRYFLTPFLIWFLHSAPSLGSSAPRSLASIALYALINAVSLWVFLYKSFQWGDGSTARFMW